MKQLKGKTALITGGSRGIGRACCLAFAREGAKVVFTYKKSLNSAKELLKQMRTFKVECMALKTDVENYDQCGQAIAKTLKKFKNIDILVNNAGITKDRALLMMNLADWKEVIDTNLGGTFNMTRSVITTFLKQRKGCILNMSSISGLVGLPRQTNYSASKAGIIGFSKSLAKEVAPYNIRVNAVCPGFINADMVNIIKEETRKYFLETIPMKRFGKPEEVADLCVFLASDKANYITGAVFKIDGGLAI